MLPDVAEVRFRRVKLGLTQTELAKTAGVSQSIIAKIEKGKVDTSYSNLKKIFDCIEELESEGALKASKVMNQHVYSVSKKDSISKAIEIMRKHEVSQIPVMDGNYAVGSISEKTVLDSIGRGANPKEFHLTECSGIMDEPFPVISEETPLSAAAELLKHHYAVLVRKGEKTTGIITKADLLKSIQRV